MRRPSPIICHGSQLLVASPNPITQDRAGVTTQEGVATDDERQMSTLHPKQRGEHAGTLDDELQKQESWRVRGRKTETLQGARSRS